MTWLPWLLVAGCLLAVVWLIFELATAPVQPADVSRLDELDGTCSGCGRAHTATPAPPGWPW